MRTTEVDNVAVNVEGHTDTDVNTDAGRVYVNTDIEGGLRVDTNYIALNLDVDEIWYR